MVTQENVDYEENSHNDDGESDASAYAEYSLGSFVVAAVAIAF